MLQCIWGASFFAFLEETRVSLGAFVFLLWALLFFKMAIFRFPDYIRSVEYIFLDIRK